MRNLFWFILLAVIMSVPVSAQDEITLADLADEDGLFADINGASIYYIARGNPDDSAVMLIHGFGGSTFTWRDTIDVLVDAGYYVVAFDLPPFGLSDKSPELDYSRRAYADIVAGLMDELSIETATIVGHSMGGSTTAYFAVAYPERVDKLVFVAGGVFEASSANDNEDTASSGGSPLGFLSGIDLDSEQAVFIIETALIPATFASIIETAYFDSSIMTDEVVAGYARPILTDNWGAGFIAYLNAVDENPISMDDLVEAVDMPVLIMWGEEDTWVPIEMGLMMDEVLANSTLITYANVGHLPMEETVDAFNTDLIAFLNQQ
ncbi:MAG: alpha/beta hydrolase [Phototrophicaceae bacterium]